MFVDADSVALHQFVNTRCDPDRAQKVQFKEILVIQT